MRSFLFLVSTLAIACGSSTTNTDAPGGGSNVTLTINNFDDWCTITEQGAASTATKSFASGTVVSLMATPNSGFVWGYWTGTDVAGNNTSMSAMVTLTADKTVLACCPFPPPMSQTCP